MTPDDFLPYRSQSLLLFRRTFQAIKVYGFAFFSGEPVPQRRVVGGFPLAQQTR
ncbi:hypothetical protein D3C75_814910 [compost metagenome]